MNPITSRHKYALLLLLVLASACAHRFPVRNLSGTPSSKKLAFCIEKLQAILAGEKPRTSLELLAEEIADLEVSDSATWLRRNNTTAIINAATERINRYALEQKMGTISGSQIYWIQQSELKELNEVFWSIGGTERILGLLDEELAAILEHNPQLGYVVHRGYKDRLVASHLRPEQFAELVVTELRERLAKGISRLYSSAPTKEFWRDWIQETTRVGMGNKALDAYLNLRGISSIEEYAAWVQKAQSERAYLLQALETLDISWNQSLRSLRVSKGNENRLLELLKLDPKHKDVVKKLMEYEETLRIADFLPREDDVTDDEYRALIAFIAKGPDAIAALSSDEIPAAALKSWSASRAKFLSETRTAGYIISTDVKLMSVRALQARDAWLANGADRDQLTTIYKTTTEWLNKKAAEFERGLREILGPNAKIEKYQSGDDALWALPPMSDEKKTQVLAFMSKQSEYHAQMEAIEVVGNSKSISNAIVRSRDGLFNGKTQTTH